MTKKTIFKNISPYLYILPVILLTIFIKFYPLVDTFYHSFTNWYGTPAYKFVGFENYVEYFSSQTFWQVLSHNIFIIVLGIPLNVILGLILAALLYEKVFAWRYYQSIFFIPTILSIVICGIIWSYFLQLDGIVNVILRLIGLGKLTPDWLASSRYSLWAVLMVIVWRDFGFATLLFLAGLLGADPSVFDAARIDGASWFQTLRYITVPRLKGIIEFFVVITTWAYFNYLFNYIYVMTGGGPGYATVVMEYYIYKEGFGFGYMGAACALSVVLFAITLLFASVETHFMEVEI